mmetsp:Transcript_28894/g.70427  ORF Transcript_28894/g.70427 Transcript_28894/m.70427 type:complete len:261 (+) Transcript_28894:941-1723(+)
MFSTNQFITTSIAPFVFSSNLSFNSLSTYPISNKRRIFRSSCFSSPCFGLPSIGALLCTSNFSPFRSGPVPMPSRTWSSTPLYSFASMKFCWLLTPISTSLIPSIAVLYGPGGAITAPLKLSWKAPTPDRRSDARFHMFATVASVVSVTISTGCPSTLRATRRVFISLCRSAGAGDGPNRCDDRDLCDMFRGLGLAIINTRFFRLVLPSLPGLADLEEFELLACLPTPTSFCSLFRARPRYRFSFVILCSFPPSASAFSN